MKIKPFAILIFFICTLQISYGQNNNAITLRTGDLLFQDIDCGDMCDAIEAVTQGYKEMKFSHVGLVEKSNDSIYVIESIGEGVHRISLEKFKNRSSKKLLVGRLKKKYAKLIPNAIAFADKQIGMPYDDDFIYGNGKYYCSELIYDAFKSANNNYPFFAMEPMTFKQPGSENYFPVWQKYFDELKMPIPEGKPGCNPGGLSRSRKIKIIGAY